MRHIPLRSFNCAGCGRVSGIAAIREGHKYFCTYRCYTSYHSLWARFRRWWRVHTLCSLCGKTGVHRCGS